MQDQKRMRANYIKSKKKKKISVQTVRCGNNCNVQSNLFWT